MNVVNAAIFEYGKLLIVDKNGIYILPGGKLNPGESYEDALRREVAEELSGMQIHGLRFDRAFNGVSPHRKEDINVNVYLVDRVDSNPIKTSAEITGYTWMTGEECRQGRYMLSRVTTDIAASFLERRFF